MPIERDHTHVLGVANITDFSDGPVTATGSTTARTLAVRYAEYPNVKDFGALGDGSTDDTAALQAAIDWAETNGIGHLYFPAGVYIHNIMLRVKTGLQLIGDGVGQIDHAGGGTGTRTTTIRWETGTGAGTQILFKNETASKTIINCGISDIMVDGNHEATYAVVASSTYQSFFDLAIYATTTAGLVIDNENGVGSAFNRVWLHFAFGIGSRTWNSHGLLLDGEQGSGGCTQNQIYSLNGSFKHGNMIHLNGNVDNNTFYRVLAARNDVGDTGTGVGMYFANGTAGNARENVVFYLAGRVHAESATDGNEILHMTMEGSAITIDAGATIKYRVVDLGFDHRAFATPVFDMIAEHYVPAGAWEASLADSGATVGEVSSLWNCWLLDPDTTEGISTSFVSKTWDNGDITALDLHWVQDVFDASSNLRIRVRLDSLTTAGATGSPAVDETFTVAAPDGGAFFRTTELELAAALSFSRGDVVLARIDRMGADVLDDRDGDMQFVGATFKFVGDGPNPSGITGPWETSPL